ncbi:MAG: TadE family protein [Planctomycetota bacterium]
MICHPTKLRNSALAGKYSSHDHRRSERRRGTVATEFALVAPILFLFFFAAFEFCRVAMIRHTADNAVYEAARVGIIPGATRGEVVSEATRVLSTIGLSGFNIDVQPANITDYTDELTVEVSVPIDPNSFVPAQFFVGQTITRRLTMQRE